MKFSVLLAAALPCLASAASEKMPPRVAPPAGPAVEVDARLSAPAPALSAPGLREAAPLTDPSAGLAPMASAPVGEALTAGASGNAESAAVEQASAEATPEAPRALPQAQEAQAGVEAASTQAGAALSGLYDGGQRPSSAQVLPVPEAVGSIWRSATKLIGLEKPMGHAMKIDPTASVLRSPDYDPELLARILDGIVRVPAGVPAKVGTLDDLEGLLAHAGFPAADGRALLRHVIELVKVVHGHEAMDHAVEELRRSVVRGDLFLFIAGKDQPPKDEGVSASHSAAARNFESVPAEEFARLKSLPPENSPAPRGAEGLLTKMNVIVHRYEELPTRLELAAWLGNFFHEASHYATLKLLSSWIAVNQAAVAAGGEPDAVFSRNVLFRGGRYLLNRTFYKTLVEGRAYSVTAFVNGKLLPQEVGGFSAAGVWWRAIEDVRAELGERAISELGITPMNFFDYSQSVSELILKRLRPAAG